MGKGKTSGGYTIRYPLRPETAEYHRQKKTLKHPNADGERRRAFVERIRHYEQAGKPIVYLDESGFAQSMPRTHGYSAKGRRCFGTHDWPAKGRLNAIGAIIQKTFVTLSLFAGNINADIFHAWMTQDLLPKRSDGVVIVMDNAPFHKRHDTIQAIANHGCQLAWLPPYSPDLNPIEPKWAETKAIRRREICSIDELFIEHINYA
ncbi:transposase [Xenorhabdus nematophila ATCC 19061]|uniref:Transposase n=1 Tax=Xenorhabdus nematophila (strain ATCC 19061 / DSM 3370 / CCUG 14189 / LMG 1036 / NCIMB 9965 / AN6) TaxID=406817 RepID=D3VGN0_XENNA|nr:IS630 family transposase [Xenorhabdus nematophila]CBJ90466.1 transposase [Xenorhabdus nematophila ATCC 19061]CEK23308.1 transposase [Xenorhabdus nematophila AN6/1]